MESVILGSMAYAGHKLAKNKNTGKINKKLKGTSSCKLSNYTTNITNNINKATEKQAKDLKENGFGKQFDAIMVDNVDNVPVGVNESYNSFNGFDTSLQRDIDFTNGYSEFSNTEMHYDVTAKENMMISNMSPHTSKRDYKVNKDNSHILGLHTGNDEFYKSKETFEPVTLFEPMKDLTYVNGAPSFTDELEDRYVASYKNNMGDLPFKANMKVTPGLKEQEQNANRGNAVYRILPKTTEEIRGITNPKVEYKAPNIESGMRGHKAAVEYKLTKLKKTTHKPRENEIGNYSQVSKPVKEGKYKKPTTKRTVSRENFGTAYNSTEGHKQKGKYEKSSKVTFVDDSGSRGVSNVNVKPVLQNSKSFSNNDNQRTSSNHTITGTVTNLNEGYTLNNKDIPLTTLRELMINGDTNIGVTNNQEGGTYMFSNDMVLPTTNRDMTGSIVKEGFMNPTEKRSNINPTDKARSTIKETTINNSTEGNMVPDMYTPYNGLNDKAKQTTRQTTINNTYVSNIKPESGTLNILQPTDKSKTTIRQFTTILNREGTINPDYKYGNLAFTDNAKQTIGETTSTMAINGAIKPDYYAMNLSNPDIAKQTIGETTSSMAIEGFLNADHKESHYYNPNDVTRDTVKQTTSLSKYISNSIKAEGGISYLKNKDNARQTIKQTTLISDNQANIRNDGGNVIRSNDLNAKKTIKETTIYSTGENNVNTGTATYTKDYKDLPRTTVKQSTLHSTQEGRAGRDNIGYTRDMNDNARTTLKQTTVDNKYVGPIGGEINNPESQDAARNVCIDDRREISTYNRAGNSKSDRIGPIINKKNVVLKEENYLDRQNTGFFERSENLSKKYTRNKINLLTDGYTINDNFINTLNDNPYVNDLMHQKR
jgi:hypothetical protein